jgi:hypothetical protein
MSSSIRDLVSDLLSPQSRPLSPQARPSENGVNNRESPHSPKSPAIHPELQDIAEAFDQPRQRDQFREYTVGLDPCQRSYHWLILLPTSELEEHFQEPITRAQLANHYPPPAVLIPFVTAADMASLWPPASSKRALCRGTYDRTIVLTGV